MSERFEAGGNDPQFEVRDAQREAIPALISISGYSDSGKTYSALKLARGLVGPNGMIGIVDTENKRALIYADEFRTADGRPFKHLDLQPPFTPERYTLAYNAMMGAGVGCIIVDSKSHVWHGEGGVVEQGFANEAAGAKGLMVWRQPKLRYKRMRNALLRSPVHMIFCLRMKEKNVQRGGEIIKLGDVPISDALFTYEMTVAVTLEIGKHKPIDPVKIPKGMVDAIQPGQYITEESGQMIAEWLKGGAPIDMAAQNLQTEARETAMLGREAFDIFWKGLTKEQRATVLGIKGELASLLEEAEDVAKAKAETAITAGNSGDALDDEFTKNL